VQIEKLRERAVPTRSYPLIDVAGSAYERGFQHGRACGDLIARYPNILREVLSTEARLRDPLSEPPTMNNEELQRRALRFLPFFEEFAPDQVTEIRGIAAGAEVPFGLALLANVRAEVAVPERLGVSTAACTSFAAGRGTTTDGSVLVGQNQDQNRLMQDLVVILRVDPDHGPRMLMATFAGLLGYGGFNSAGLGFMQNSLANSTWRIGLPHYPLKRAFLEQDRISGCLAALDRVQLASCGNYMMVDRERIVDIETTPDGYVVLPSGASWLAHANHFRDPGLAADEKLLEGLPDSAPRCRRLDTLMAAQQGTVTLDDAKRWLSDHDGYPTSICRHPTSDEPTAMMSMYSVICEPDNGRLHITVGNPCTNPYQTYTLH
jgi:isopenicillin-N N-acyltransferase like protein